MLEKTITMEGLLEKIGFIKELYEMVRIVDPIKKQVLSYQNSRLVPLSLKCYDVWEKNQICENCISVDALKEDETFAKIEYLNQHVYMVLAIPIHLEDKKVILELLRDVTEERILFDSPDYSKVDVYKLLKNRNINSIRDSLTNAFNNRYIQERLPYDILKSHMQEQYLSIIMIDIDNFKEINKKYGRQCGNKVLIEFAKVLEEKTKKSNAWVARYTADVFIIVVENHSPKEAKHVAEDLRDKIEGYDFTCEGAESISITARSRIYTKERVDMSMEQFLAQAKLFLEKVKDQKENSVSSNVD